jgi:hypothetical protein
LPLPLTPLHRRVFNAMPMCKKLLDLKKIQVTLMPTSGRGNF